MTWDGKCVWGVLSRVTKKAAVFYAGCFVQDLTDSARLDITILRID